MTKQFKIVYEIVHPMTRRTVHHWRFVWLYGFEVILQITVDVMCLLAVKNWFRLEEENPAFFVAGTVHDAVSFTSQDQNSIQYDLYLYVG